MFISPASALLLFELTAILNSCEWIGNNILHLWLTPFDAHHGGTARAFRLWARRERPAGWVQPWIRAQRMRSRNRTGVPVSEGPRPQYRPALPWYKQDQPLPCLPLQLRTQNALSEKEVGPFFTILDRIPFAWSIMKSLGLAAALVLALALFHPVAATTGTVGYEAGVIAIVVVLLAAIISMGIGLSVCLYRNDLIPCFANDPTKA